MEIFETPIFTKQIVAYLSDEKYRELQWTLIENPLAGNLIPGCYGIRKLRWSVGGSGKRGGLRVIYYFLTSEEKICLLFAYKKSVQQDLSKVQLKALSDYVKENVYEG